MTVSVVQPVPSVLRTESSGAARCWPRRSDLVPLLYYFGAAAILAFAGYPAWRIASLALPAAAQQLETWMLARYDPRACVKACGNADAARWAWSTVRHQLSVFVTTTAAVAVTGAVHSPLLVTMVTAYLAALIMAGDRRETRLLLGATGSAVCALALLPRALSGPDLSRPFHAALVVLSVLGVGALLAPLHSATRRMGQDLSRAREEMASEALARARCLEQIGTKVAHELKNPLTAVKALVQLGVRNESEAPSHERLQVVEREVARMQEILADYLSFTRPLQEVRPQRTELGPLVADALLALSARADLGLVQLTSRGDATAEVDPRRIKEAILNLVANGIEATGPGGAVAIEIRSSGDQAEITVRDTGRGMPAETLNRLGTPFFSTREEGTGLGVVLARSVVAQHGGTLRYESEPGKGTTATLTLPARLPSRCRDAARAAGR